MHDKYTKMTDKCKINDVKKIINIESNDQYDTLFK